MIISGGVGLGAIDVAKVVGWYPADMVLKSGDPGYGYWIVFRFERADNNVTWKYRSRNERDDVMGKLNKELKVRVILPDGVLN